MELKKLISNLLVVALVSLAAAQSHSHLEFDDHGHSVADDHDGFCLTCELAAQVQALAIDNQAPQLLSLDQSVLSESKFVFQYNSFFASKAIRAPPYFS